MADTRKINAELAMKLGINPVNGLPLRYDNTLSWISKADVKKNLRIIDEQDAVNRFTWYNLPSGLNSRLVERILYYRGQGAFFQLNNKFYFLPYALDGNIDVYGRYRSITPLPFNGQTQTGDDKKQDRAWIQGLSLKPRYEIELIEDFADKTPEEIQAYLDESCVILKDYTEQQGEMNISRKDLNDPILDIMSECIPFMRTALLNNTGVLGMRVGSETEKTRVREAAGGINKAALNGEMYVPIVGELEFQELNSGTIGKSEEYLLAMQALDNLRLSFYGIENGGLFQKKAHILQAEQEMNSGSTGLILRDSLKYRQDFCNIVNSIWGLGIWCEPSEVITNVDMNGDGILGSNEDKGTNMGNVEEDNNDNVL